jgi:hypothetical protein
MGAVSHREGEKRAEESKYIEKCKSIPTHVLQAFNCANWILHISLHPLQFHNCLLPFVPLAAVKFCTDCQTNIQLNMEIKHLFGFKLFTSNGRNTGT